MNNYKQVTKDEFYDYIESYEGKLETSTAIVCEPPIRFYEDWSLPSDSEVGTYKRHMDSVVGKISLSWLGPNGESSTGDEFYKYMVRVFD